MKLNVLGLTKQHSGCGYHRVVMPCNHMENIVGLITDKVDKERKEKFDVLLFNRLTYWYDEDIDEARRNHSCKLIMDMDDDWILPTNHILHNTLKFLQPYIENNLRNSDMVTCTNERLADKIFPFNKNVHILPNALPYGQDQFLQDKVPDDKTRLFWCGSVTHEHDIALLRNPISRLQHHKDNIKMVIGGYTSGNNIDTVTWNSMVNNFTYHRKLAHDIYGGMMPARYMQLYEFADICLIPLEKSDWHACKSNLKILEAATKKIPVIVSNVEPYNNDKDIPVLWVNKTSDWYKHINYLINNKSAAQEYGEKLYEWCKEKYNFQEINTRRRKLYESIVGT